MSAPLGVFRVSGPNIVEIVYHLIGIEGAQPPSTRHKIDRMRRHSFHRSAHLEGKAVLLGDNDDL